MAYACEEARDLVLQSPVFRAEPPAVPPFAAELTVRRDPSVEPLLALLLCIVVEQSRKALPPEPFLLFAWPHVVAMLYRHPGDDATDYLLAVAEFLAVRAEPVQFARLVSLTGADLLRFLVQLRPREAINRYRVGEFLLAVAQLGVDAFDAVLAEGDRCVDLMATMAAANHPHLCSVGIRWMDAYGRRSAANVERLNAKGAYRCVYAVLRGGPQSQAIAAIALYCVMRACRACGGNRLLLEGLVQQSNILTHAGRALQRQHGALARGNRLVHDLLDFWLFALAEIPEAAHAAMEETGALDEVDSMLGSCHLDTETFKLVERICKHFRGGGDERMDTSSTSSSGFAF
jgi:hypothetical protein